MVVYILSPFLTQMNNREPVIWGPLFLPALTLKDAVGVSLTHILTLIPFVLAFNYLNTPQARRTLLEAFWIAALIYSVPMMLEVRLTPQFSNWIYNVPVALFSQQVRFGGFRPVMFMGHGLVTAFFTMFAVLATAILFQGSKIGERSKYFFSLIYLFFILLMCKSVGSILFAVLFLPIILFTSMKVKAWTAVVCAVFVICYPVLRASDLVPTERMVGWAAMIQEDRAASLDHRFNNEEILLERASEKPVTGWGLWNRTDTGSS